jgi:glycosyltransferase involved in cell wall biosynthesis
MDLALEARVVRRADAITAVTEPIARDIEHRFGEQVAVIPNAFDPALEPDVLGAPVPTLPRGRHLVVHTGALSGLRGRDPTPVLEALHRVSRDRSMASRICLVHAGTMSAADEAAMRPLTEIGLAHPVGVISRSSAIALQRRAAALLLITSDDVSQSTAKVYEYLAAGRPIIALAENNEAARIVRETGCGITLPTHDVNAITDALCRVVSGELERSYAPRDLEQYLYPAPAIEMEQVIETALERKAKRLRQRP